VYYRIRKFVISTANLTLLWLMFKLVTGQLDWGLALGSVLLSGLWLALTTVSLRSLFTTYYDWMSRARIHLPLWMGVALSVVAIFANESLVLRGIAGAELLAWAVIFFLYRRNKKHFEQTKHGWMPAGVWINPPVEVIRPGDLILTSGNMARTMDQAVGHGEVAVQGEDGKLYLLSSYMLKGTVINDAERILKILVKKRGEHYIVLRLRNALSTDQIKAGWKIAEGMLCENVAWREDWNARRIAFIGRLWLPERLRQWLTKKTEFTTTGYDWVGLFIGFKARNRWTCIGACAEWYARLRVPMRHYGTGLLGVGTGILDPIQPQRFMTDKSLKLLTLCDKEESGLEAKE
jgi:hypothetical protein